MEQTVKQRLVKFLSYKGLSQKRFAEAVGVSSGYVNSIRQSIQPKTLHKISMCFPDLNTGWLLTGNGDMLVERHCVIGNTSGIVIDGQNRIENSSILQDNRHCSDVLRAQIELMEERLKEKDAQIKEKDAQIKQLLDILQGMKK